MRFPTIVQLPALAERREDVVLIARDLRPRTQRAQAEARGAVRRSRSTADKEIDWTPAMAHAMASAPWPGNVRQLQSFASARRWPSKPSGHSTRHSDMPRPLDGERADAGGARGRSSCGPACSARGGGGPRREVAGARGARGVPMEPHAGRAQARSGKPSRAVSADGQARHSEDVRPRPLGRAARAAHDPFARCAGLAGLSDRVAVVHPRFRGVRQALSCAKGWHDECSRALALAACEHPRDAATNQGDPRP